MNNPFDQFDNPTLDSVMPRLIKQESGGRAGVVGPQTPYGRAIGRTQMLPDTAKGVAQKLGVPYREDLLSGTSPEAAQYQDMLGRAYLEEGYQNTGSVDGALKYYHGGPNRDLWGPKTEAYANAVGGDVNPFDQFDASATEPPAAPQQKPQAAAPPPPKKQAPVAPPPRVDQGLGFLAGVRKPLDNLVRASLSVPAIKSIDDAMNGFLGMPNAQQALKNVEGDLAAKKAAGVVPGKIGEFAGNVIGTLPTAALPGGVIAQGAAGGALLTDKRDFVGVAQDAVLGALTGKIADSAIVGAKNVVSNALAKAPKIMDLPQLEAAKKAAYKAVDQAGFNFPKTDIKAMVDDFSNTVKNSALSKSAKDDANSIISYARTLSKGDLSLAQLEKLRGDIYEAMVKKGGDTSVVGKQFRQRIDALIDSVDNGVVKNARNLNARYKKADYVTKASQAADINAERTYGGDYGRKLKDRLYPLINPQTPNKNFRGATADERAAIERIVRGTKGQNLASTVGGMLDPRRMGGKILTGITAPGAGIGAPLTGGLSLAIPATQMAAGVALTGAASRTARKELDNLVRLIAAGGSTQALKKVPTRASQAAERALERARASAPVLGASSAASLRERKR